MVGGSSSSRRERLVKLPFERRYRPGRQDVHDRSVRTRNLHDPLPFHRRFNQQGKLFVAQGTTIVPSVHLNVEHCHVDEWIVVISPVTDQPSTELLDCPEVVVARLSTETFVTTGAQIPLYLAGRDVGDRFPFASSGDLSHPCGDLENMLGTVPLVFQVLFKLVDVLCERPFKMFLERIEAARVRVPRGTKSFSIAWAAALYR